MNPYLPGWEYIPDGEPRVFGDRVYVYGSHDKADSDSFCDSKLKVWSASIDNLNYWTCHGDIFHIAPDEDHESDIDWEAKELYAPDVVYKDGKYYLYAYIFYAKGCVAVSDKPEGPFKLLSQYVVPKEAHDIVKEGIFVDPGVLVDDDGRVYVYCGFEHSFAAELKDNMYEVVPGTSVDRFLPEEAPFEFFEACSPRKVGDTYYMIYSPKRGSRLAYATSKNPLGPYEYRGYIVDNGDDYPGGNDHGSICKIKDQWYIFYHRMTNHTIMSRRGCVEKIEILPDGTIPTVEMTSLGFADSLNPYEITPADIACVLKEDAYIIEVNRFDRQIANIKEGCIAGYKYYDFGEDYSSKTMGFEAHITSLGSHGRIRIIADDYENGEEIGVAEFTHSDTVVTTRVKNLTGRHAIFLKFENAYSGSFTWAFEGRCLCQLKEFVFVK